jgi:glutaredoxin 3
MKDVTIFTTKYCAYCKPLKQWFDYKNVTFKEYDVTEDVEMRKELYEKTGYATVPIVRVNDKYVVGPQYGKIAELLV